MVYYWTVKIVLKVKYKIGTISILTEYVIINYGNMYQYSNFV